MKDTIYRRLHKPLRPFSFNAQVSQAFDDMAVRSIPGYCELQHLTGIFARKYTKTHTRIYDVGCSTGNTLMLLLRVIKDKTVHFVGVDKSQEMLKICAKKIARLSAGRQLTLILDSAQDVFFQESSLIIFNYTLQFMDLGSRLRVLKRAYRALQDGGALILSEKTKQPTQASERLMRECYRQFKLDNGYTELEIDQKDKALKGILRPLTEEKNFSLLKRAGFRDVFVAQKTLQFCCFLAVK